MKQRLWFIAALVAVLFTAYTLVTHAQTGGALHPYLYGSLVSNGDLTLVSTFNATKGDIFFGAAQNSTYDENSDFLGIGTDPNRTLDVAMDVDAFAGIAEFRNEHASTTDIATIGVFGNVDSAIRFGADDESLGAGNVNHLRWEEDNQQFYFAIAGTDQLAIVGKQILMEDAAGGTPEYSLVGSATTGFGSTGTDTASIWADAVRVMDFGGALVAVREPFDIAGISGDGYIRFSEDASVAGGAAPATDDAYLFVQDNGSAKTQVCAKFSTGAVQCFATQP